MPIELAVQLRKLGMQLFTARRNAPLGSLRPVQGTWVKFRGSLNPAGK